MNMGLLIIAAILVPVALAGVWIWCTIKRKVTPAIVSGISTLVITNIVVFFVVHLHHFLGWYYIDFSFHQISKQATKSIANGTTESFARVFQDADKGNIGKSPRKFSGTLGNLVVELRKACNRHPAASELENVE